MVQRTSITREMNNAWLLTVQAFAQRAVWGRNQFRPSISLVLTHWGRVTHICVGNLAIIGSDNGLSPGQRQVIIRTNAGILLIETLGTNFSEILGEIHTFSFKEMHLKMSSAKWRLFPLGLNVLNERWSFKTLIKSIAQLQWKLSKKVNSKYGLKWEN